MTSLFPPLGQLPVKTSPRPHLLRTFEPETTIPVRPVTLLLSGAELRTGGPRVRRRHFPPSGPREATQPPLRSALCSVPFLTPKGNRNCTEQKGLKPTLGRPVHGGFEPRVHVDAVPSDKYTAVSCMYFLFLTVLLMILSFLSLVYCQNSI